METHGSPVPATGQGPTRLALWVAWIAARLLLGLWLARAGSHFIYQGF